MRPTTLPPSPSPPPAPLPPTTPPPSPPPAPPVDEADEWFADSPPARPRPRPATPTAAARPTASASDVIAALWQEREGASSAPAAPAAPAVEPDRRRASRPSQSVVVGAIVAVVALAAGAAAVLVTRGGAGPPKAEFIRRADAICAPANAPTAAMLRPGTSPELAAATGTVATSIEGQLAQLPRLPRPSGVDGSSAKAVRAGMQATGDMGQRLREVATAKDDLGTVNVTAVFAGQFNATTVQAKAYGVGACASGGLQASVETVFGGAHDVLKTRYLARPTRCAERPARRSTASPNPVTATSVT